MNRTSLLKLAMTIAISAIAGLSTANEPTLIDRLRESDVRVRFAIDHTGKRTDRLVALAIPHGWKWTDESRALIRDVLEIVDPMPRVYLIGPRSREQEERASKLAKAFPELSIRGMQAAYLGVRGKQTSPSCRVDYADPQQPADVAGLTKGDTITTIDGKLVTKFEDLKEAMRDRLPGETVQIIAVRDGAEIKFDVSLAAVPKWD